LKIAVNFFSRTPSAIEAPVGILPYNVWYRSGEEFENMLYSFIYNTQTRHTDGWRDGQTTQDGIGRAMHSVARQKLTNFTDSET